LKLNMVTGATMKISASEDQQLTLKISKQTHHSLHQRAKEKGFLSAEAYIENILEQVAQKITEESSQPTKEDEERVKQRLAELGYLD